jgi:hypothetical protein
LGQQHLGILPASLRWEEVIALIAGGADVRAIAQATSAAAEASLKEWSQDRGTRCAFFLLAKIPLAAREADFAVALRKLGLRVGDKPNLVEISAAFLEAVDDRARRSGKWSDLGEIAAISGVESLRTVASRSLNDLFGDRSDSFDGTRDALAGLGTVKHFGFLAKDFFARLIRRHLDYYLSRALPAQIDRRFASLREHLDFDRSLERHCRETAHIITRFAGEWHSKAEFEGGIDERKAGGFIFEAFRKIEGELSRRREAVA